MLPDVKIAKLQKGQGQPGDEDIDQTMPSTSKIAPVKPANKPHVLLLCIIMIVLFFFLYSEVYIAGGHSDNRGGIGEVQNNPTTEANWWIGEFSYRGPFAGENNK